MGPKLDAIRLHQEDTTIYVQYTQYTSDIPTLGKYFVDLWVNLDKASMPVQSFRHARSIVVRPLIGPRGRTTTFTATVSQ